MTSDNIVHIPLVTDEATGETFYLDIDRYENIRQFMRNVEGWEK